MPKKRLAVELLERLEQKKLRKIAHYLAKIDERIQKEYANQNQLITYKKEYERDAENEAKVSITTMKFMQYRNFIHYLSNALHTQEDSLKTLEAKRAETLDSWRKQYIRCENLQDLIDKKRQAIAAEKERRANL